MKIASDYSRTQKILHWTVAVLFALQLTIFGEMGRPFHDLMETGIATYSLTVIVHIAIGLAVFALAAWRILLRRTHGAMAPPENEPDGAKLAAKVVHVTLYGLMFLLPLTGLAAWFGQNETLAEIHHLGKPLTILLIVAHVGAVLVHHFYWKNPIIARMK